MFASFSVLVKVFGCPFHVLMLGRVQNRWSHRLYQSVMTRLARQTGVFSSLKLLVIYYQVYCQDYCHSYCRCYPPHSMTVMMTVNGTAWERYG